LNDITCLSNFMTIYLSVQKLLVRDKQTGNFISLLSFLKSSLKILHYLVSIPQFSLLKGNNSKFIALKTAKNVIRLGVCELRF
jgi:hypothetical protein